MVVFDLLIVQECCSITENKNTEQQNNNTKQTYSNYELSLHVPASASRARFKLSLTITWQKFKRKRGEQWTGGETLLLNNGKLVHSMVR